MTAAAEQQQQRRAERRWIRLYSLLCCSAAALCAAATEQIEFRLDISPIFGLNRRVESKAAEYAPLLVPSYMLGG